MLPPDYLEKVSQQASYLYNSLEFQIIEEISTRIANVGYANTVVKNNVAIAQELGMLYTNVVDLVAKETNKKYDDILKIFTDAGIKTIKNDDKIYKEAGLNPIPIKQDKEMLDFLLATVNKTNGNLSNLVMTTAEDSQKKFMNAMNSAYMQTMTGVKSYSQAIIDAVDELSNENLMITYPSGHRTSLEAATRMNVVTGVSQTCGKMQEMRAEELNWDLMELTAHSGARPEHAEWQGKIVSRSGQKGYLSLEDIEYGTVTGFKGINCYHDWNPYFEGSTRRYTDEQLENWKNEKVVYNGKEMTKYEASQMQRQMERQIRQDKKDISGMKALATSSNDEKVVEKARERMKQLQVRQSKHTSQLNDFLEQTNSRIDNSRLKVAKFSNNVIIERNEEPLFKNILNQQERMYSKKELKILAKESNDIVNKYITNKSKWKQEIVISNRKVTAKLWNCKIELENYTAPHIVIHEQLHAHSISYFDRETYKKYAKIEEATVELMAKEIGKLENIINIPSSYDELVDDLVQINNKIKIKDNTFDYAKELFEKPVTERLDFLEEKVNNYIIANPNISIQEMMELRKWVDELYV